MAETRIVQIIGQPGSGKTEICKNLAKYPGSDYVTVSDIIKKFAQQNGLSLDNRQDYSMAHAIMSAQFGNFAICNAILQGSSADVDTLFVDGLRVPEHSEMLREHGIIIALHCYSRLRYKRSANRLRKLGGRGYKAFREAEIDESIASGPFTPATLTVMGKADYHVHTSGPITSSIEDIKEILLGAA